MVYPISGVFSNIILFTFSPLHTIPRHVSWMFRANRDKIVSLTTRGKAQDVDESHNGTKCWKLSCFWNEIFGLDMSSLARGGLRGRVNRELMMFLTALRLTSILRASQLNSTSNFVSCIFFTNICGTLNHVNAIRVPCGPLKRLFFT